MLEMPRIENVAEGFHYTFMVLDTPKIMKADEDNKASYAYSLHYLVSSTRQLLPIAADMLPYNDDPLRLSNSLIAAGFFLVEHCGLF
jgi:hypothetical protein